MAEIKKSWLQVVIQIVILTAAMAVAWGYQRSTVENLKADVVRIDSRQDKYDALRSAIDGLTVEVKYLHEMIQEERDARVHNQR